MTNCFLLHSCSLHPSQVPSLYVGACTLSHGKLYAMITSSYMEREAVGDSMEERVSVFRSMVRKRLMMMMLPFLLFLSLHSQKDEDPKQRERIQP